MTGTKNRNLPFGPHIYGWFTISWTMTFSLDGTVGVSTSGGPWTDE
jgi:hypothetical protein